MVKNEQPGIFRLNILDNSDLKTRLKEFGRKRLRQVSVVKVGKHNDGLNSPDQVRGSLLCISSPAQRPDGDNL